MKTFKIDFPTVFAVCATIDECKAQALNLQEQIKAAYAVRAAEINSASNEVTIKAVEETPAPADPKQKPTTAATPQLDPAPKAEKGKGKKDPKEIAKAMKSEKKEAAPKAEIPQTTTKADEDVQISITDKAAIAKLGLTFEKYSERCYVLRGNTKPIRETLKKFNGSWQPVLRQGNKGKGWTFRIPDAEALSQALGIAI